MLSVQGHVCGSSRRVLSNGAAPSHAGLLHPGVIGTRISVERLASSRGDRLVTTRRVSGAGAYAATSAGPQQEMRSDALGAWWYWALAALCAGGVSGLMLAIYASFSGQAVFYQMGVQAAYICSLGVILWRIKDALQQHIGTTLSNMKLITDGKDNQNRQLRALVGSLKQQLEDSRRQLVVHSRQADELRSSSSSASTTGHHLQQQLSKLKSDYVDLAAKHEQAMVSLQQKLRSARAAVRAHNTAPQSTPAMDSQGDGPMLPMPPAFGPPASPGSPRVGKPASRVTAVQLSPGHERESLQLEARAERLENELAATESQMKAFITGITDQCEDTEQPAWMLEDVSTVRSLRDELVRARSTSRDVRTSVDRTQTAIRDLTRRALDAEKDAEKLRDHLEAADAQAGAYAARVKELEGELQAQGVVVGASGAAAKISTLAGMLLDTVSARASEEQKAKAQVKELEAKLATSEKHLAAIAAMAGGDMLLPASSGSDAAPKPLQPLSDVTDTAPAAPHSEKGVPSASVGARAQAVVEAVMEGKVTLEAQVQELRKRCGSLGVANEELRVSNEELLFMMDTREALVEQLKGKISELAKTNSASGADRAVSEWLRSIRPALEDAMADLQDKKAFLENAKGLCETLKADVSALKQLSDETFAGMPPDVSVALARAAEETKALRAAHEEEVSALRSETLTLTARVESAETAAKAAQQEAADMRRQLKEAEEANARLQAQLELQKEEAEERVEALQGEISETGTRTKAVVSAARAEAATARMQHASLMRAYESLQAVHSSTKEKAEQEAARAEAAIKQASEANKLTVAAAQGREEDGVDPDVLVVQLQEAEERNLKLQREVRRMEKGMAAPADARTVRHLRAEVTHLKASNSSLRTENEQLKSSVQEANKAQDELRSDSVKLLRELEIAKEEAAASDSDSHGEAIRAAAEADAQAAAAQADALQSVLRVFEDHIKERGDAHDAAQVMRIQAQRIVGQRQTIDDLNDLLRKRDRDMRRMRGQLKSITRVPKEGVTLKQLAAQAALSNGLQEQVSRLSADNETLRRAAQQRDYDGLGARAGRQLQALASAFALGDSFQEHAAAEGERNEELCRQSSAVIDFDDMLPPSHDVPPGPLGAPASISSHPLPQRRTVSPARSAAAAGAGLSAERR